MRSISPLRYPGSKPDLVEYFASLLRENLLWGTEIVEPFAGSASLSLALLERGAVSRATLIERDPLLYAFWKQLKIDPEALCRKVERTTISIHTWRRMQYALDVKHPSQSDLLHLALACVFLNRTNFSGILHAKPIGGISQESEYKIGCRFNKQRVVAMLRDAAASMHRITVAFGDGVAYLRRRGTRLAENCAIVYVDPPYYIQGRKLYRYHYTDDDHRRLAAILDASSFKWVVSYDNHPFIRRLFKRQDVVPIFLNYVVKESRRAQELLISNMPLLPVKYVDAGPKRRPAIQGSGSHSRRSLALGH